MITTYFSPNFKGSGQQMANTDVMEGSLWGVDRVIHELEWKVDTSGGKTQAHYQGQLRDLCRAREALQEELAGLTEERASRVPPPPTSSLVSPRPEKPVTPAGHGPPETIQGPPPRYITNYRLCQECEGMHGCISTPGEDTEGPSEDEGAAFYGCLLGQSPTGQRKLEGAKGGPEAMGLKKEDEMTEPKLGPMTTKITFTWRPVRDQCQSCSLTTSV